jgi:Zn-finger nucleic acid-binding protein
MMYCPLCAKPLQAVERQGIEIDHCPSCGGLWLDSGELNTLIEREAIAALRVGERAMLAARQGKEYDTTVYETDEFAGRYGATGQYNVPEPGFAATFAVSSGDRVMNQYTLDETDLVAGKLR